MSSLSRDADGTKRIQFLAPDRRRVAIRLGAITVKEAEAVQSRVDRLINCRTLGLPMDGRLVEWINTIDDALFKRLARAGLVEHRSRCELEAYLHEYHDRKKRTIKASSLKKSLQAATKLIDFFGPQRLLVTITRHDADDFFLRLKEMLSLASAKGHIGYCKAFFNEALKQKLVTESPFADLKSGTTPNRNDRYVTPEEIARVIDACPSTAWKTLVGLARYAGLRIPSEINGLTWADIDWDLHRMLVHSPKTEHHPGQESRVVPIDPRLLVLLEEAYHVAGEGSTKVIDMNFGGQVNRKFSKIISSAGVEPWAAAFQTLRRSREIEWARDFPGFAASRWLGHSEAVSHRHYTNVVPDELYEAAAGRQETAQKPAQHAAAGAGTDQHDDRDTGDAKGATPRRHEQLRTTAGAGEEWKSGAGGIRTPVPKQSASRVYMHSHQLNLGLITAR